ncbi:outer membrane lipase/esterase [Sphingobium xanthum]|jgi:outer membrane lipase/esterase|uniref:SGNH/GDSL hydrolase family protein n=1 Tax=Sphingobium xanthum TaxID=1387165 RepID=UPI001FEC4468|nr:SGNH/GDSL hydrolase family protein [Sphingobium xanthum]
MKRLTLCVAVLCSLVVSAPASAFSKLLVFGDSLVDAGNAQIGSILLGLPDPAPAALGYYEGRFSNGPNFADYLSQSLFGMETVAYLAGGHNFAVGGAEAAFKPGEVSPSFLPQLQLFQNLGEPIASDALVLVTFGGNDVRSVLTDLGAIDFTPTLNAFATGLSALAGAGAQTIIVTGLPDIGKLPDTLAYGDPAIEATATARTIALNAAIEGLTVTLSQLTGTRIDFYHVYAQEQALRANPGAYGLTNLTESCQSGGAAAVLGGCAGYLYFDTIHPTSYVHALLAQGIVNQLPVPEPATWLLMILGLGMTGVAMRRGGAALATP